MGVVPQISRRGHGCEHVHQAAPASSPLQSGAGTPAPPGSAVPHLQLTSSRPTSSLMRTPRTPQELAAAPLLLPSEGGVRGVHRPFLWRAFRRKRAHGRSCEGKSLSVERFPWRVQGENARVPDNNARFHCIYAHSNIHRLAYLYLSISLKEKKKKREESKPNCVIAGARLKSIRRFYARVFTPGAPERARSRAGCFPRNSVACAMKQADARMRVFFSVPPRRGVLERRCLCLSLTH
jgi:hypothetical protein